VEQRWIAIHPSHPLGRAIASPRLYHRNVEMRAARSSIMLALSAAAVSADSPLYAMRRVRPLVQTSCSSRPPCCERRWHRSAFCWMRCVSALRQPSGHRAPTRRDCEVGRARSRSAPNAAVSRASAAHHARRRGDRTMAPPLPQQVRHRARCHPFKHPRADLCLYHRRPR
jgi:hypothetical protein